MQTTLVILRGNSGSGKTTIAQGLQEHFGRGTLLVSQDTVRRDMLKVQDRDGNLSTELIRQITQYGKGKCPMVVLEGIFFKGRYEELLLDLIHFYDGNAYVYYFDLSFEETVKRHELRPKAQEFGADLLKAWWNPKDFLGTAGETALNGAMTEKDILDLICRQVELCNPTDKST